MRNPIVPETAFFLYLAYCVHHCLCSTSYSRLNFFFFFFFFFFPLQLHYSTNLFFSPPPSFSFFTPSLLHCLIFELSHTFRRFLSYYIPPVFTDINTLSLSIGPFSSIYSVCSVVQLGKSPLHSSLWQKDYVYLSQMLFFLGPLAHIVIIRVSFGPSLTLVLPTYFRRLRSVSSLSLDSNISSLS